MRSLLLDLCLALAVASAWLGALAAIRLRSPLDRLHAVGFVNVAGGGAVALAGLVADGLSVRSVKLACLVAVVVIGGAAASHAVGRALLLREGPRA